MRHPDHRSSPKDDPGASLPERPRVAALSAESARRLHARLVARDEQALVELIDMATPWVLGIAQSILRDSDEAEEVRLETFTIAWERVGHVLPDPRGILAWVARIARNRSIDRLRAHRRRLRKRNHMLSLSPDSQALIEAAEVDEAGTPGWHVHRVVHKALADLPVDQQTAVRLAFFHGLTHSEIATQLEIPLGTVKTRLNLAFGKLRHALRNMKDWVI